MSKLQSAQHVLCSVILAVSSMQAALAADTPDPAQQKTIEQTENTSKAGTATDTKIDTKSDATDTGAATTTKDSTTPAATTPSDSSAPKDATAAEPPKKAEIPPAKMTPADRPAPKGQDAAVKLYSQKKFALAAKEFQKFCKDGTANVNTHAYLAYCLYNMRQYHAALQQFAWVAKYSTKSISLQMSAERSVAMISNYMRGICPGQCLKTNDPRWQHLAGQDPSKRWIKFTTSNGWQAVSDAHLGQVVVFEHGDMVNKGTCPICGGTGTVPVLHDGDPVPQ